VTRKFSDYCEIHEIENNKMRKEISEMKNEKYDPMCIMGFV